MAKSCANGNPQREHIVKEEAAVPTMVLKSMFMTSTIDAKESRNKVVTINVPGTFLHTDNVDYVIMKMVRALAELMAKTHPRLYRQYIVLKKGKSVVYLRLHKALYCMMKSVLLFYRKIASEL